MAFVPTTPCDRTGNTPPVFPVQCYWVYCPDRFKPFYDKDGNLLWCCPQATDFYCNYYNDQNYAVQWAGSAACGVNGQYCRVADNGNIGGWHALQCSPGSWSHQDNGNTVLPYGSTGCINVDAGKILMPLTK